MKTKAPVAARTDTGAVTTTAEAMATRTLSVFWLWISRRVTVTCHNCRIDCRKFGKRQNRQRYQCTQCRKVFTDARDNTLEGMYLPLAKAEMVLRLLLEGCSVSTVERITEVHHTTILKLLLLAGEKCEQIMARKIVDVKVRDVELDEVWSFIQKKEKRVRPGDDPHFGDCCFCCD